MFEDEGEAKRRGDHSRQREQHGQRSCDTTEGVHPVWSPESEGGRVNHVAEVDRSQTTQGFVSSWKDFGIYLKARPKSEGLLSSLSHLFLLSPFSLLLTISYCLGCWVLRQSNGCSQNFFSFSHHQPLNPRFFHLERTSEDINSSPLILFI